MAKNVPIAELTLAGSVSAGEGAAIASLAGFAA
jgi:hypothetical protein